MAQFEPARAVGLAYDDLGDAVLGGVGLQPLKDRGRWQRGDRCAQLAGELQDARDLLALRAVKGGGTRRFNVEGGPLRALAIGEALGGADQCLAAGKFADRHEHAFARCPGALRGFGIEIVEHARVDRLRALPQRQFAQGRQIRAAEEMPERPARFLRDVDLPLFEPLDQLIGRDIDDLELGLLENAVGHSFADAYPGERRDRIVQALEMLDVDRRENVDPSRKQFFDILPAFGVPAAGDVGVREFVHQHESRFARQDRVEVHLMQGAAVIFDCARRHLLEVAEQRHGLLAAVGFDHAYHDITAAALQRTGLRKHLVGFAHPRRGAQEYLQLSAPFPPCLLEQRIGVGPGGRGRHHRAACGKTRSRCRLSSRRLTRGSPRTPSSGSSIAPLTSFRVCAGARPRAAATRSAW